VPTSACSMNISIKKEEHFSSCLLSVVLCWNHRNFVLFMVSHSCLYENNSCVLWWSHGAPVVDCYIRMCWQHQVGISALIGIKACLCKFKSNFSLLHFYNMFNYGLYAWSSILCRDFGNVSHYHLIQNSVEFTTPLYTILTVKA
jgi:hypothetical protein